MSWTRLQHVLGTRATSGSSCTATYGSNLTAGSVLVAVMSRVATATNARQVQVAQSIGDGTNKWKHVIELSQNNAGNTKSYGTDIWICESAVGGSAPTVTCQLTPWPNLTVTSLRLNIYEWSGATGVELVDAFGVLNITGTTVSPATNYTTTASTDLVISAITGDMSAATVPTSWQLDNADSAQGCWVADNMGTVGASVGVQTAAWTGLTGATTGAAVVVALRATGNSSGPSMLQNVWWEPVPAASPFKTTWTGPGLPASTAAGSVLVLMVTGASYDQGAPTNAWPTPSVSGVTDTAGNTWVKMGEQTSDPIYGLNWAMWICRSSVGGAVTPTVTFATAIDTPAYALCEVGALGFLPVVDRYGVVQTKIGATISTGGNVQAGDIAFAMFSSFVRGAIVVPGAGWNQYAGDSAGVNNGQYIIGPAAGGLTATVGSAAGNRIPSGLDIVLFALGSKPVGAGIK